MTMTRILTWYFMWVFFWFCVITGVLAITPAHAGVTNGQPVNAATTNAAFMDKNANTFTTGTADFQNTTQGGVSSGSIKSEGGGYIAKNWLIGGNLVLEGSTSGAVSVGTTSIAGTWTLTLPTSGGSNGQFLQTNGSGTTVWAGVSGTISQKPTIQNIVPGTTSYYLTYVFTVTSASATAPATYTNGSATCTVEATISGATTLYTYCTVDPGASGTLTKTGGTGDSTITFSGWVKPVRLEIIGVAGGGGGASSGTGTSSNDAQGGGANTTFGSILSAAGGGAGKSWSHQSVGAGGGCTTGDWGVPGGNSGPARCNATALTTVDAPVCGSGGSTPYGQGAAPAENQGGGAQACTGYGSGGGTPGAVNQASAVVVGSPGGGGGTCFVNVLASSLSYPVTTSVGTGGAHGLAGTSGAVGSDGCNGVLIIREFYNY